MKRPKKTASGRKLDISTTASIVSPTTLITSSSYAITVPFLANATVNNAKKRRSNKAVSMKGKRNRREINESTQSRNDKSKSVFRPNCEVQSFNGEYQDTPNYEKCKYQWDNDYSEKRQEFLFITQNAGSLDSAGAVPTLVNYFFDLKYSHTGNVKAIISTSLVVLETPKKKFKILKLAVQKICYFFIMNWQQIPQHSQ
uniref:Uncharacterized protein n=1 Tax=Romanomermis culicivorax TaxID=13658 RepID=A0A915ICJ9_ROMCU